MEKASRRKLLLNILKALMDEWSPAEIHKALSDIEHAHEVERGEDLAIQSSSRPRRGVTAQQAAAALLNGMELTASQKKAINDLAADFDAKRFLPTRGDIKYFLEAHGKVDVRPVLRARADAFRSVFGVLSGLSESALQSILDNDVFRGPSQLAPLSDAMREVGYSRLGRSAGSESEVKGDLGVEADGSAAGAKSES